jgi:hypothetical protein
MFRRMLMILFATRLFRMMNGHRAAYPGPHGFFRKARRRETFGAWRGGGLLGPGGLFGPKRRGRWL